MLSSPVYLEKLTGAHLAYAIQYLNTHKGAAGLTNALLTLTRKQ